MFKRTLVTSALPYANGPLHLGHIAGAYLPADLFVRFKRLKGEDIVFICGSDEHGVPITIAAEKEGTTPQAIVDRFHGINKQAFKDLGISFDHYGRTSSPTHRETSQEFFKVLEEKGTFIKKTQDQLYDEEAKMFLPDRYVIGDCPVCGNSGAYGDQCEKCGSSLSPTELKNPKSAITGATPIKKETEHWFLPLGDLQPKLEEWIAKHPEWKSNVLGQVKSWFSSGLGDRAVTRDLSWGVPVPLEGAEGKVLYVWFDAPIGYISATKEWAQEKGDAEEWKKYWQNEESRLIHFIGKDNIVFHCIIFPSMLMEHGEYVIPDQVPANEFLNLEGQKLSTSRGWAVWVHEFLEDFDADLLRYVLGSIMPENKDADFSWKDFQGRVNTELADVLGNFIFRSLTFANKYFEGKVPELVDPSDVDKQALTDISSCIVDIEKAYNNFQFKDAISNTMKLARIGNKYFTDTEPWKTRKTDMQACANAVHVSLQISAALSVLFDPIMPTKMQALRNYLNLSHCDWARVNGQMLAAGHAVEQGEILFKKIEDETVQAQIDKLESKLAAKKASTEAENKEVEFEALKENIVFDDFMKLDLRVGTILSAEKMKKSNKLLKIEVDLGFEKRTILSGIAKHFDADKLVGTKVTVVANLAPRKMMGIESQGMILMAEDPEGTLHMVGSDNAIPGSFIA